MAEHSLLAGLRLAVTTLTIVPLRPGRVDRAAARVAMAVAPGIGALVGLAMASTLLAAVALGSPPPVAGGLVVGLGALLTRGLHVDGLADTVDALGSYRDRAAALAIMRRPDIGPFGVVALVLVLLVQSGSLGALAGRPATAALSAVVVAAATGRQAMSWACQRGVPAARPEGLGALVAGTLGRPVLALTTAAVLVLAVPAVPARPWQGPLAVSAGLLVAALLRWHAVRRFGGITGDVLGAANEAAATTTLVLMALG